jgi:pseudaminic acid cytidylyltransferase
MKIFIPIKEISQRVPKKNFRLFDGVPLYKHTLYKLKDFEVYVDTDSEEILKEIQEDENLRHVVAYKRDTSLIGHEVSVCELIHYFIYIYCDQESEIICQVHVTSPFLNVKTLTDAHTMFNEGYDSVASCNPLQTRLWRKEKYGMCPVNHNPTKLEQTQDLPIYYEENSLFYMFYSDDIANTGSRIGNNPYFYTVNFPENLDIDTEDDWKLVNMVNK